MTKAPLVLLSRFALACGLFSVCFAATAQAQIEFPLGIGNFGGRGSTSGEVSIESQFTPATADRPAVIFVTVRIAEGFHVYATDQGTLPNDGGGPLATQISLVPGSSARVTGPWQPIELPKSHIDQEIWTGLELREHYGEVIWFVPVELEANADPKSLSIEGKIEGQACNPQTCIPFDQSFTAKIGEGIPLPPGTDLQANSVASVAPPAPNSDFSNNPSLGSESPIQGGFVPGSSHVYDLTRVSFDSTASGSLIYYLLTAFLGGVILNIMPCVLPVIGLKVMSFVQQAGQSRAHALALNCWYSAGIVAVFLVLASLAVTLQLGWGGQFGSAGFNISLIAIVFAMALSLLGMWEIPIPGFVGSNTAVELVEREGPPAAFLKGVLTTLLATPCIGPFMATALAWAVKQPAWMTYSVFGAIGLGMASPYLLIGAFPKLICFLPRPGEWMESFKKIMGLVLLATVVWLLTFIEAPLVVPTVALMVGITAACWRVSKTPITAPIGDKSYGWAVALLLITITAIGSYGWLYKSVMLPRFNKKVAAYAEQRIGEDRLRIVEKLQRARTPEEHERIVADLETESIDDQQWQRFTLAKLGQLTLGEGRTVLVDFTADWCLTCKTLEKLVLKTQPVEEALTKADVVTMEADYTKKPQSIDRTIKALGGVGVPIVAIFPGSDPYNPIVFSDGQYTKQGLINAIARATGRSDLQPPSVSTGSASLSQANSTESLR